MKQTVVIIWVLVASLMISSCGRDQRGGGGSRGVVLTPTNEQGLYYSGLCEFNADGTINQVIILAENVNDYVRFYSQSKDHTRQPEPFGVYYWNRDNHGFWVDGAYIYSHENSCYLVMLVNEKHVAVPVQLTPDEIRAFENSRPGSGRIALHDLVKRLDLLRAEF